MHFCFEFQLFSAEIHFNIKTLIGFKQKIEVESQIDTGRIKPIKGERTYDIQTVVMYRSV